MEILGQSVFRRNARQKTIKLKDGSTKAVRIAAGWIYRIRYVDDRGRRRTEERGSWDLKGEATRACDLAIANLEKSSGNIRDGEQMTFSDLATVCEREIYASKAKSNKYIIQTLRSFFGPRRLAAIDRGVLQAYIDHRTGESIRTAKSDDLKRSVKRSTVDKELRIMRSMIYHAIEEGWLLKNPFRSTKKLRPLINKAVGDRERVLSIDEERRLIEFCEPAMRSIEYKRVLRGNDRNEVMTKATGNENLKAIVLLALDSGMRLGEVLKLKWKDIDERDRLITIPAENTKTKRARLVPLSERTIAELSRLRPSSAGAVVFPVRYISRAFRTALRLAGVEHFTFHDLRRTFTTRQVADGTNLALIAKATGHQDVKVLMEHYAKTGAAEMQQIADRVDAANLRNQDLETDFVN